MWTSEPNRRSEERALIACAQTLELAEALTRTYTTSPVATYCRSRSDACGTTTIRRYILASPPVADITGSDLRRRGAAVV